MKNKPLVTNYDFDVVTSEQIPSPEENQEFGKGYEEWLDKTSSRYVDYEQNLGRE